MKIILASTSLNRKALLDRMKIQFEIAVPDYEEIIDTSVPPQEQVAIFALGKAQSVYNKYKEEEDVLILGFDSMIEFQGGSVGKSKTKKAAFEMIQSFLGKPQNVVSGIAIIGNVKGEYVEIADHESTHVTFKKDITNCQIQKYLEFGDWSGKCGAYSILGTGQFFIEKIDGDFQNIIGIPVIKMGDMIQEITGKNPITIFEPVNFDSINS